MKIEQFAVGAASLRTARLSPLCLLALCAACGGVDPTAEEQPLGSSQQAVSNKDFDVDFSSCAEFVGIGLVPAANAQPFVPAGYTLAGGGGNALVVVRIASCSGAVVDGKSVGQTTTSQVGITLQGPDESADINNYTVYYGTNQARLHARFEAAGLSTDNTGGLSLTLAGSSLSAVSAPAQSTDYQVSGTAVPSVPTTTFTASWWGNGQHGVVRSRTVFPAISFGGAATTLTTEAGSDLATLFGGTTLTFPILDSYNTFAASHLEVRDQD